jgi:hypothetical protein
MEYKIAYRKDFDFEGYCYRQRITATLTAKEFIAINDHLRNEFKNGKFFAEPLDIDKNYTTITTAKIFAKFFGIDSDKRLLDWANTVILINLK